MFFFLSYTSCLSSELSMCKMVPHSAASGMVAKHNSFGKHLSLSLFVSLPLITYNSETFAIWEKVVVGNVFCHSLRVCSVLLFWCSALMFSSLFPPVSYELIRLVYMVCVLPAVFGCSSWYVSGFCSFLLTSFLVCALLFCCTLFSFCVWCLDFGILRFGFLWYVVSFSY